MKIQQMHRYTFGIRISIVIRKKEVAHAYLYFLNNDKHDQPFALLEEIWIIESHRSKGYGSKLVERLIKEAKEHGCYKIIVTSGVGCLKAHNFYQRLGFIENGKEFRINL